MVGAVYSPITAVSTSQFNYKVNIAVPATATSDPSLPLMTFAQFSNLTIVPVSLLPSVSQGAVTAHTESVPVSRLGLLRSEQFPRLELSCQLKYEPL